MIRKTLSIIHFRWFLLSNAAFFIVLHGQMLTRSVLAWELTQDEMALAWINLAFAIPMILLAFPGGALNDRINRLQLLRVSQVILLLNETVVWLLIISGALEFWHLLLAGFIGGSVFPVVLPARNATIFNLVGGKLLGSATALSMTVMNVTRVVGPAASGLIIASHGVDAAYGLAVALSIVALVTALPIPLSMSPVFDKKPQQNIFKDALEGLHYMMERKAIILSIAFGFLPLMLLIPLQNLMILFTTQVWPVGEHGLGLLMAAAGLGGTVGAFWIASRGENTKRVKLMVCSMLAYALLSILFSFQSNFHIALVILFFANCGAAISTTLNNTSIQLLTDDQQRGRVSSITMAVLGFAPLAVVPMSLMAKHWGISTSVTVTSLILLVAALWLYAGSKTMREMDQHVEAAQRRH